MDASVLKSLQTTCDELSCKTGSESILICVHHERRQFQIAGSSMGKAFLRQQLNIPGDFLRFIEDQLACQTLSSSLTNRPQVVQREVVTSVVGPIEGLCVESYEDELQETIVDFEESPPEDDHDSESQSELTSSLLTLEHSYSRLGQGKQTAHSPPGGTHRCKDCGTDVPVVEGSLSSHDCAGHGMSDVQECGNSSTTKENGLLISDIVQKAKQLAEKGICSKVECEFCGAVFGHTKELKRHLKLKHKDLLGDAFLRCDKCGAEFYVRSSFQKHKKDRCLAMSRQCLSCALCGFEVSSLSLMKNHALMHVNVQEHVANNTELCKFQCDHCRNCTHTEASFLSHECTQETPRFNRHLNGKKPEAILIEYLDKTTGMLLQMTLADAITVACKDKVVGKRTRCFICKEKLRFTADVMKMHLAAHAKDPIFYCRICDKRFRNFRVSRRHKKTGGHLKNLQEKGSKCELCNDFFETKEKVEEHQNYECPKKNNGNSVANGSVEALNKGREKTAMCLRGGSFQCDICGRPYTELRYLMEHWETKHRGRFIGSSRVCDWCDAVAENYNVFLEHISVCPKRPMHKCSVCDFEANSLERVRQHETVHEDQPEAPGMRGFKCEVCRKKLKCLSTYNRHRVSLHGLKRIYPCALCGAEFHLNTLLKNHTKDAHGKKEYHCSVCSRSFKNPQQFKKHRHRQKHMSSGKSFMCEVCGKSYPYIDYLKKHQLVHSDTRFECDICGRKFVTKYLLNYHFRDHIEDKHWTCRYCQAGFESLREFKTHLLEFHPENLDEVQAGSNLRFYPCTLCGQVLLTAKALKRHERRAHGGGTQ